MILVIGECRKDGKSHLLAKTLKLQTSIRADPRSKKSIEKN